MGPIKSISACSIGLPTDGPPAAGGEGGGGRRIFTGHDLEDLNVEQLAIRHYLNNEGFTCGLHCEGSLLRDLFGILLFDELFDTSVAGVFASTFQDAPMDLGTEAFYLSRRRQLEQRLGSLAGLSARELAADVNTRFRAVHGRRIRGVRWDRYEGPSGVILSRQSSQDSANAAQAGARLLFTRGDAEIPEEARRLGAVAGAIGGAALAAALRQLCEDHNSAGLPDLLVWTWNADEGCTATAHPRARFVEVKSERDSLAKRQRAWLAVLRGAGAEAEVCHVRDNPRDVAAPPAEDPRRRSGKRPAPGSNSLVGVRGKRRESKGHSDANL